ncbi:MAG: hypothetical protein M3081_04870, partial [Gemmatimonadota bacterium]|nr:hypothetical protein [Gemmatimonadota bacterium]
VLSLRLLEQWRQSASAPLSSGASALHTQVAAVRQAIDTIEGVDSSRGILSSLLSAILGSRPGNTVTIRPRLMAYGRVLELDARWTLAADVYETVVQLCGTTMDKADVSEVTTAYMRLGECRRQLAQWDAAHDAYSAAVDHASLVGDRSMMIRNRCYVGDVMTERGNLPGAEIALRAAETEAEQLALTEVRGIARHSRSTVAFLRRDFESAVQLAYSALEDLRDPLARERALADVAASFSEMGVRSAARDAFLVVAATAQEPFVRQTALLNLMELAAMDRTELVFEQYRRDLATERLPARVAGYYHLYAGAGALTFGRLETARAEFDQALSIATERGISQLIFQTEAALADLKRSERRLTPPVAEPLLAASIAPIADALAGMREQLGARASPRGSHAFAGAM